MQKMGFTKARNVWTMQEALMVLKVVVPMIMKLAQVGQIKRKKKRPCVFPF